jgi:hypothetical protein
MLQRYESLSEKGLLHVLQVTRDCQGGELEVISCTADAQVAGAH